MGNLRTRKMVAYLQQNGAVLVIGLDSRNF